MELQLRASIPTAPPARPNRAHPASIATAGALTALAARTAAAPTGALGAAGLFEAKVALPPGSRVGVLISGGNVDVRDVCRWIA